MNEKIRSFLKKNRVLFLAFGIGFAAGNISGICSYRKATDGTRAFIQNARRTTGELKETTQRSRKIIEDIRKQPIQK